MHLWCSLTPTVFIPQSFRSFLEMLFKSLFCMRNGTLSIALHRKGKCCRGFADMPPFTFLKCSCFTFFCSNALAIAVINYISLVALETEVKECIVWIQRKRNKSCEKERKRQKERRKGWELRRNEGRRKWLLRDQPRVRLASGDINTSDAARATILPFTAGEGDKHALTKEQEGEHERGLACLHSPQASSPIYRYSTSWWTQEQRDGCSLSTVAMSKRLLNTTMD